VREVSGGCVPLDRSGGAFSGGPCYRASTSLLKSCDGQLGMNSTSALPPPSSSICPSHLLSTFAVSSFFAHVYLTLRAGL
jgi:hypothetical protein